MPEECVVDTSCLIVLNRVGLLSLLCEVYEKVYLARSVVNEFGEKPFLRCVEIVEVSSPLIGILTEELNLGLGEAETTAYAYERGIRAVIDDAKARKIAEKLLIKLTGTLGVLIKAEREGVIESSYQVALELRKAGFRVSEAIIERLRNK